VAGDDAEARKRRAQQLRRQIGKLGEGNLPEGPPRSPHEFIEREMREYAEREREEGSSEAREEVEQTEDDPPPVDPGPKASPP
jgi:hypothetical protein